MKPTLPRYALHLFAVFCLGFSFMSLSALPALAGETIVFNSGDEATKLKTDPGLGGTTLSLFPGTAANPSLSGNSITVNSGDIPDNVFGAHTTIMGDAVINNRVFINGGTVGRHVVGGYSNFGSAMYNSVTISGGTVGGDVIGGWSLTDGNATYNTVTISGSPSFDPNMTDIMGGGSMAGTDSFTGNTLNVWNYSGNAVNSVQNFQFLNFTFPATQTGPVLTVDAGGAVLGDGAGVGSTITANTLGGTTPLQPGASVTLIDGTVTGDLASTQATGQHGATLSYNWALNPAAGLIATLDSVQASPQAKSLSEGKLAGLSFLNMGYDRFLSSLAKLGDHDNTNTEGKVDRLVTFASLDGASLRHNSGSHVDVAGVSLVLGLGWRMPMAAIKSSFVTGAFIEMGWGSYSSYNSFNNFPSVKGKGNTEYYGAGFFGRYEDAAGFGGLYGEASVRAGRTDTDFRSRDITGTDNTNYDSDSTYYGAHVGVGYAFDVTTRLGLDVSAKYLWTRQTGDSLTLGTGDPVKFKSADSQRLRLGGQMSFIVNDFLKPYGGLYWEHEFDGRARATTYGYSIAAPKLRGDTGAGELGLSIKPAKAMPLSFDIAVQGYVGKREGVTGSLQGKFEF